jgi:hypothetical protein
MKVNSLISQKMRLFFWSALVIFLLAAATLPSVYVGSTMNRELYLAINLGGAIWSGTLQYKIDHTSHPNPQDGEFPSLQELIKKGYVDPQDIDILKKENIHISFYPENMEDSADS